MKANKVGRPKTGRIGWWSVPLWQCEREQRSIMRQHRYSPNDFMNHVMSSINPIDNNEYIATCINETLRLIDKRVQYRAHKRDQGLVIKHGGYHCTDGYLDDVLDADYSPLALTISSYRDYQNGYFNEIAMERYLLSTVVRELVKWLNGDVDRSKWVGKIDPKKFPDLDSAYQPFVKFMRTVINRREKNFKKSKLHFMTCDNGYTFDESYENVGLKSLVALA